ncbi:MAG: hypothetical protein H0V79_06780 [Actinobacteria bacterium]|nr:hypothetical protein [Actinomycetota bacterium]
MNAYDALGRDLHTALGRKIAHRARRKRIVKTSALSVTAAGILSAGALASGVLPGLDLDPTRWEILGRGEVDGKASYVNARERATGSESTFVEERDAGLDRYDAFLLHQKTMAAAGSTPDSGAVCTADQLTRAEIAALETVAALVSPGVSQEAGQGEVAAAVEPFGCSGRGYAGERARWVYARTEPIEALMPGARATARRLLGG